MERLTEWFCRGMVKLKGCSTAYSIGPGKPSRSVQAYAKLAEYEDLEEAGNLVRLAVPVDGYLYKIVPAEECWNVDECKNWCVERYKITEIKISWGCICYVGCTDDWRSENFWDEQLKRPMSNKFVFTSREEAEAELKRRKGGNNNEPDNEAYPV